MSRSPDAVLHDLRKEDPEFFEIYNRFVSVPGNNNVIDAKSRQLINVALSASPTCLCKETLAVHMKNAVSCGASKRELLEVLKMASALGLHACGTGVPILVEEMEAFGSPRKEAVLDQEQMKLKERFVDQKGYWSPFHNILLDNDKHFFESYSAYAAHPLESDLLHPKLREFILIALNSSTTHVYTAGIRIHIRQALKCGATFEEIMEVFKLAAAQGANTFYAALPVLNKLFPQKSNDNKD